MFTYTHCTPQGNMQTPVPYMVFRSANAPPETTEPRRTAKDEQPVRQLLDPTLFHAFSFTKNTTLALIAIHFNSPLSTLQDCRFAECFKSKKGRVHGYRRFTIMEHCRNPWHDDCKSNDIEVYIQFRGERRPICRRCWGRIAERDLEW